MATNDKDEKIKELLQQAEDGTKAVFESEKYRHYLATMSKFHNYSYRNSLLIHMQKPDASYVAGFSAWKTKFKRQVQKGEKGIRIIGYVPRKVTVEQERKDPVHGTAVYGNDGKPIMDKHTREIPGFATAYVFDVSQTQGEPLPKLVNELDGTVESYNDLMAAITTVAAFPIKYENIVSGAKGYSDPINQIIAINTGMSEVQTIKTAIHEITHADLHAPELHLSMEERKDRRTKEVEAESTAFVVCSHYGIDTSDYSFPYLASWSSDKELKELQNSLETIQKQASDLIDRIDTRLEELQKDREHFKSPQQAEQPTQKSPFAKAGRQITYDYNTDTYTSKKRGMKDIKDWSETDVMLFTIETDIALHGEVQKDTLAALNQAGYNYHDGQLEMLEKERLNSIIHDNDIDLDREKTREQLGFRDQDTSKTTVAPAVPVKMSMKERMAAAKQEAERRSENKDTPQKGLTTERGEL